jgi:hypothetical protein
MFVTTTVVDPVVPGGAVTTSPVVLVREVTVALTPPIVTWAWTPVVEKPVPVMVTDAPEISWIDVGFIPEATEMIGAGTVPVGVVKVLVVPYVVPILFVAMVLK